MKISADDLLDIMAVASNRIHRELKNAYTTCKCYSISEPFKAQTLTKK